jgi:hypothetical protein
MHRLRFDVFRLFQAFRRTAKYKRRASDTASALRWTATYRRMSVTMSTNDQLYDVFDGTFIRSELIRMVKTLADSGQLIRQAHSLTGS